MSKCLLDLLISRRIGVPDLHERLEQQLGHNMAPTPESVTPPPYSWI
jgi:hypothetical protein